MKKMIKQKIIGVIMLLLCMVIIVAAAHMQAPEDRDVTPVLLFAPMGLYLIFSKERWIN